MKTLQIALDGSVSYTCYYALNKDVKVGSNDRFFEGKIDDSGKRIKPLQQAKIWAKENDYTHLEVVRITRGKDKLYVL